MKKFIAFYLCLFLFTSQICYHVKSQDRLSQSKPLKEQVIRAEETACESCRDKILMVLQAKDSLTIDESKVYAILKQNCEICKASYLQTQAIKDQTRKIQEQTIIINDKPNASSPLWFMIIVSIVAGVVTVLLNKK